MDQKGRGKEEKSNFAADSISLLLSGSWCLHRGNVSSCAWTLYTSMESSMALSQFDWSSCSRFITYRLVPMRGEAQLAGSSEKPNFIICQCKKKREIGGEESRQRLMSASSLSFSIPVLSYILFSQFAGLHSTYSTHAISSLSWIVSF